MLFSMRHIGSITGHAKGAGSSPAAGARAISLPQNGTALAVGLLPGDYCRYIPGYLGQRLGLEQIG